MDRIYWIEQNRVAGRCGPSVEPLNLTALHEAGFATVLSLDANEYRQLERCPRPEGLELKLIHLTNSIPPKPLEVKIFEERLPEAIEFLTRKAAEGNGAVLVHCHAGNDRTGGVLTGWLARTRNLAPRAALEYLRTLHPDAISAMGYEPMILRILEA